MALIFQRLARNFIKNGYFPTDEATISRVLAMLEAPVGQVRICDPCCGEGIALAECAHYLKDAGSSVFSAGIEFNAERASNAKQLLDHVVHSDIQDCVMSNGQFNLLWLNPPYGDRITDQTLSTNASEKQGRDRLEKYFLSRAMPTLAFGGLLIFIIPHYVLDRHLAKQLARSLSELSVYRLPEDQFKQVVIMGYRRRGEVAAGDAEIVNRLVNISGDRDLAPELPEVPERFYQVSTVTPDVQRRCLEFRSVRPTAEQAWEVSQLHPCLWDEFSLHFGRSDAVKRPPARALSDWHLSLMLAAGQVSGVVTSKSGRQLLVKGSTHKEKELTTTFSEDADGNLEETRILTDRFVPVIKAIDVTPGAATFGDVLTIR